MTFVSKALTARRGRNLLARQVLIRADLHLNNRGSDDLAAHMLLDSLICSLELEFKKLSRIGTRVMRSAHTNVSNAVLDRTQQLATVNGTERITDVPANL
jgi:hypothetical protein